MKALRFILSGKTACFRKPDVNVFAYFTYNNIHKPSLLGILGAIIGLGGHNQLFDKNRGLKKGSLSYDDGFPEFYKKLKELKIAITPLAPNGYFSKKIQTFNNSVGYASFEQGGNLVVREQWLENPSWQILILDDESEVFQKINEYLLGGKSVFIPYLGKNDHPAKIDEVRIVELSAPFGNYIDSLFIKNFDKLGFAKEDERPYLFQEIS
jgi:CRISPR-associated protein Cas5h